MSEKLKYILPTVFFLTVIDQISKYYIKTHFFFFTKIRVIEGLLNLVYVRNKGVAFGFLSEISKGFRNPLLIWIPVITCIVLFIYILINKALSKLEIAGFVFIIGGAVGNLIDRIFLGSVIDFIDLYYRNYHWPAFNFADMFISIGIGLIFIDVVLRKLRK